MLSLRIALRYLVSKKSHNAVNIISAISVAGVMVATAAIVIVLSVFNGFTDLAASQFSRIDPQLKVSPSAGKVIANADSIAEEIASLQEIADATPTLTERGLLINRQEQLGVVFMGVNPNYTSVIDIDSAMIDGRFAPLLHGQPAPTTVAIGVASRMKLYPGHIGSELYVPRRVGRINPANPAGAFDYFPLTVTGVMQIDQMEFDVDHIIVPIDSARRILQYDDGEATAIELRIADNISIDKASNAVKKHLGAGYIVETQAQQQAESFKMIAIEKWVTFAMLIFILIIATFNIVSTLSLLVIEKRDNMETLRFMGCSRAMIRRIFMFQGAIITITGGFAGCLLGVALSLAQQIGGFVKLAGDPSKMTISVYPVRVELFDIVVVAAIIILVALLTSQITRIFTKKIS